MDPKNQVFQASNKKPVPIRIPVKASPPVVLCQDIPPGTKLTFVDITHNLSTIVIESRLNHFSALIDAANEWLQKNYFWKVLHCETVELVFKEERLDPYDYGATKRLLKSHLDYFSDDFLKIKSLRLWIKRREDMPEMKKNVTVQCIKCMTFIAKNCHYFKNTIGWEQLDDVIDSINEAISSGRISGKLMNAESVYYDANEDYGVDPEYPKQSLVTNKQQIVIRVYYESGNASLVQLSLIDFVPEVAHPGGKEKFEPFETLLKKAENYLAESNDLQFLSAQSIVIRYKEEYPNNGDVQTRFMIHNNDVGYYLRYLRVAFIKQIRPAINKAQQRLERQKTYLSFCDPKKELLVDPKANKSSSLSDLNTSNDSLEALMCSSTSQPYFMQKTPLSIEAHSFEILHHYTLHGPYYPVKRAIEEFVEWDEWDDDNEQKWIFLGAETFQVLSKDEENISKRVNISLFTTKPNVLVVPRVFHCIRIYYDTSLMKKSQRRKMLTTHTQSLDCYHLGANDDPRKSVPEVQKYRNSISCNLM